MSDKHSSLPFPRLYPKEIFTVLKSFKLLQDKKITKIYGYYSLKFNKHPVEIYLSSHDVEEKLKRSQNHTPAQNPNFIYIARKGKRFNGHTLASSVLSSGNFFVGHKDEIPSHLSSHPFFLPVKNTEQAANVIFRRALAVHPRDFHLTAVTGTNGKTSVTRILNSLIENLTSNKALGIGTLGITIGSTQIPGSHVTTPDFPTFLLALSLAKAKNVRDVVLEATSHGLKEKRLGSWKMNIAILTNLTRDHLDYHGNMQDYMESKKKLFSRHLKENGTAVISTQGRFWEEFANAARGKKRKIIGVGELNAQDDFFKKCQGRFANISYLAIIEKSLSAKGIAGIMELKTSSKPDVDRATFCTPLAGGFQFENVLCATGAALAKNKNSLSQIASALSHVPSVPGRLEIVPPLKTSSKNPTIFIDYAHTPDALEKSISTCNDILKANGQGGVTLVVFGCGGDRDREKRPLMGEVAARLAGVVIITSDNPRHEPIEDIVTEIANKIKENTHVNIETDRRKAIALAIKMARENDIVLVAGKGHEEYQIIGDTKHPFSDLKTAEELLKEISRE